MFVDFYNASKIETKRLTIDKNRSFKIIGCVFKSRFRVWKMKGLLRNFSYPFVLCSFNDLLKKVTATALWFLEKDIIGLAGN